MYATSITPNELLMWLYIAARRDTSANPDGWSHDNPLWGHCAIASAIAQKIFGGEFLRYDLAGTKYAFMGSHYINLLPDGTMIDFTGSQFGNKYPIGIQIPSVRKRSHVLDVAKYPQSVARYKLLFWRILGARYPKNALFDNEMYRECFFAALDSDCAKMHFGCAFVHNGQLVHVSANTKIPAIAHRCEPECCRANTRSRADSMVGACAHAEEGLWGVANSGIKPSEVELYIAGFYPDMTPWLKIKAEHTCIRCATAMQLADVKAVYVPVVDDWEAVDLSTMLDTAFGYALGEKNV